MPVDFSSISDIPFRFNVSWLRFDLEDFKYPVRNFAFEKLVVDRSYLSQFLTAAFGPSFVLTEHILTRSPGQAVATSVA